MKPLMSATAGGAWLQSSRRSASAGPCAQTIFRRTRRLCSNQLMYPIQRNGRR